jgi:hypothetical protein
VSTHADTAKFTAQMLVANTHIARHVRNAEREKDREIFLQSQAMGRGKTLPKAGNFF